MKNNLFVMAALAVLATACVKEQQPTDQAPADVEKTVAVSVAEMPSDALFGTWSGTFNYNVVMGDVA